MAAIVMDLQIKAIEFEVAAATAGGGGAMEDSIPHAGPGE